MNELEKKLISLLQAAVQNRASDIHIMTGFVPSIRLHGELVTVNLGAFSAADVGGICQFVCGGQENLETIQEKDGSFEVKGLARFRYNVFRAKDGLGLVLRVINTVVPSIDQLGMPKVLKTIAESERGLILVTGATGSGKSSTLASLIDHINTNQSVHILTIEDPVEFIHPQKKARISQREIGRDTANFSVALRSALRQDPDVILLGEMRDYETLDIALKAAETGHLVLSTVHTSDTMKTIGRLLAMFSPEEQINARIRLADNLKAIVSQRLVPKAEGVGRVVVQEILINNASIHECIMNEKKTFEIPTFIQNGNEVMGMQTFDQHLTKLVAEGKITMESALTAATNPADFVRNAAFGETALSLDESKGGTKKVPTSEQKSELTFEADPRDETPAPPVEVPLGKAPPPSAAPPPTAQPRPMPTMPAKPAKPATPMKPPKPNAA